MKVIVRCRPPTREVERRQSPLEFAADGQKLVLHRVDAPVPTQEFSFDRVSDFAH